jgi:hypothetical protein
MYSWSIGTIHSMVVQGRSSNCKWRHLLARVSPDTNRYPCHKQNLHLGVRFVEPELCYLLCMPMKDHRQLRSHKIIKQTIISSSHHHPLQPTSTLLRSIIIIMNALRTTVATTSKMFMTRRFASGVYKPKTIDFTVSGTCIAYYFAHQ